VKRLTETKNNEFAPSWSPDGKTIAYSGLKRLITSSETNMEDTHVWTLEVATGARCALGAAIDNRQGRPQWSPDGQALYFTVQSKGSVGLYRLPTAGGTAERIGPALEARGTVGAFTIGKDGLVVAAISSPAGPAELYTRRPGGDGALKALTSLNKDLLGAKKVAETEAFTFRSFDGRGIEAFVTKPPALNRAAATRAADELTFQPRHPTRCRKSVNRASDRMLSNTGSALSSMRSGFRSWYACSSHVNARSVSREAA